MPRKSKKEIVEPVVIEKPKRGRKKKVVPKATAEPVEESVPAPVPKKRVRKKKVKVSEEPPVVIEEVKEEKPKKVKKSTKVEKKDEPKKKKRPPNKWLIHVKEFRSKNPDMKYSDVLKNAKASYTK
jgi:hypothetical protein